MENKLKLKEIVVIAMLSAILGVVFTGMDSLYQPIQNIFGPLGGDMIGGIYFVSALLPAFIVRKPGAAITGSLFTGIMNLLLGSPYGIHIIVASALQGIAVEIVLAIGGYKKYSIISMALAGMLATVFVTTRDYFVFGLDLYGNMMFIMIGIRLISAALLGGGLSIALGNGLKSTGVLNGFKINKSKSFY